jgi:hypothetical protein
MNAPVVVESAPDWLVAEMPPGYQNRVLEIQRLSEELREMNRFGGLLFRVGADLAESVREAFAALGFDAELLVPPAGPGVAVKLGGGRRLLALVPANGHAIQKKDAEIARVFQLVHEVAEGADRVVMVVNHDVDVPPANRTEPLDEDALRLVARLGANVLRAPTLFDIWSASLKDKARARGLIERLHEQDGGQFAVSSR